MNNKTATLWGLVIIGMIVFISILLLTVHFERIECIKAGYTQEIVPTEYVTIWVKN